MPPWVLYLRIRQEAAGSGEDAATPHQGPCDTVGGGHAQDELDRLTVVEAPVAAHHQGAAVEAILGVENGLDEVLQVMRLLEDLDLLAQPGGPGALSGERLGADDAGCHGEKPLIRVEGAYILPGPRKGPATVWHFSPGQGPALGFFTTLAE